MTTSGCFSFSWCPGSRGSSGVVDIFYVEETNDDAENRKMMLTTFVVVYVEYWWEAPGDNMKNHWMALKELKNLEEEVILPPKGTLQWWWRGATEDERDAWQHHYIQEGTEEPYCHLGSQNSS